MRVGDTVTVSGKLDAEAMTGGAAALAISLPVPSLFGALEDCAGTAFSPVPAVGGPILADHTNDRAGLQFTAPDGDPRSYYFHFTYQVIR
jgi:hypothetical protein